MDKYKKLGVNTLLIFIGNIGSKFIGLIMLPFYTRWLSVEEYGVTDVVSTYVTLFLGIVSCCIYESIFVFPKGQDNESKTRYLSTGLVYSFVALLIAGIAFGFLPVFFPEKNSSLFNYSCLIFFMLASQLLQKVTQSFTRSNDNIIVYSITGVVVAVITAVLGFLLVPEYGVNGYILGMIVAHTAGAIYSFIFSKSYRYCKLSQANLGTLKEMLKYSLPLVPASLTWWMIEALNRPIMEQYVGYYDIGIYAVANKFPSILSTVFVIFGTSWQVSVMEEYGKPGYSSFYNNAVRGIFVTMSVCLLFLTAFCIPILKIFTTEEYFDARFIIPLLSFSTLLSNVGSMAGTNFLATKQSKYMLYTSIWSSFAAIFLNFILIPRYGLYGAVVSTFLSLFVLAITRVAYSWKFVHLTNILHYFLIMLLVLAYFGIYYWLDGNWMSVVIAFIFATGLIYIEKEMVMAILQRNKYTAKMFKPRHNDGDA